MSGALSNNRGVALLIVLLVTALLLALVFEFAYATRISLNSAVNFRDAQRAYFLARSGVYAFIKSEGVENMDLKMFIPEGEWGVVPIISEGDTELRVRWEDELGKIKITRIRKNETATNPSFNWMNNLFMDMGIDQNKIDEISEGQMTFYLTSQLHEVLSDEDFARVQPFLTTAPFDNNYRIKIYSAPREVLTAIGISQADQFIEDRAHTEFKKASDVQSYFSPEAFNNSARYLDFSTKSSGVYKVSVHAAVGGYTKQIEAIVQNKNISYWRAL